MGTFDDMRLDLHANCVGTAMTSKSHRNFDAMNCFE